MTLTTFDPPVISESVINARLALRLDPPAELLHDPVRDLVRSVMRGAAFRTAAAPQAPKRAPHPMLSMRPYWKFAGRVPSIAWNGVENFINLKQEAFCGGLLIRVSGSVDIAVSGALHAQAPYKMIAKFKINPPGGAQPWNCDGWNTKMFNFVDKDFMPFLSGAEIDGVTGAFINGVTRNATSDESFLNAVAAAQTFSLWFFIPFHRSAFDLRGVLPVGTDDVYQLGVTPGADADIFTTAAANITNRSMNVDVYQLIYEKPRPGSLRLDQRWLYTTEERINPSGAVAVGDYEIVIPKRESILVDWIHTVVLNDAQDSADIDKLTLELDGYFFLNAFDRIAWDRIIRGYVGKTLPLGVIYYPWDRFKDADGAIAQFDSYFALSMAEWLDQRNISYISSRLHVNGGVAGTSRIVTAIRRLNRIS